MVPAASVNTHFAHPPILRFYLIISNFLQKSTDFSDLTLLHATGINSHERTTLQPCLRALSSQFQAVWYSEYQQISKLQNTRFYLRFRNTILRKLATWEVMVANGPYHCESDALGVLYKFFGDSIVDTDVKIPNFVDSVSHLTFRMAFWERKRWPWSKKIAPSESPWPVAMSRYQVYCLTPKTRKVISNLEIHFFFRKKKWMDSAFDLDL